MTPSRLRLLALASALSLASTACNHDPPASPRDAGARAAAATPRRRDERPNFPDLADRSNKRHDCFPRDFRTARVRARGEAVEICGHVGVHPHCFMVDLRSSEVTRADATDAPSTPPDEPVIEAPVQRFEVTARGGRVSTRGGSLVVSSAGGGSRTVTPRGAGFADLGNALLIGWADNHFVALVGFRAPDLGASSVIDPSRVRMLGQAAELPCGADAGR
ncbi:MAG: hypothetical protein R3A52_12500 [Polyangiales bacterium]